MERGRKRRAGSTGTVLLLALLALFAPGLVQAQETQVPLDEEGRLMEVDRSLARRLDLFLDRQPDLQVVRLYREGEDRYVLEFSFQQDGRAARQRVPMTLAEVRELRARVSAALAERAPQVALDQDGRFLLLGTTTVLGLGYYGWAVPYVLDIQSGRGVLATYMLTAGASFVVPYLYTRDRPVTYGMANAGFWGATRGILHGVMLANVFDRTPDARTANALGLGMSVGEALGGYTWAGRTGMNAGEAHTIGNHGDYGFALAGSALIAAQPGDERVSFATLLAGAGAGLAVGAARAPDYPHTWGDAEIQRTAFYLGAANGAVIWDVVLGNTPSDDQLRVLGPLLAGGSMAGLLIGDRILQDHDFTAGQAILVDLGTVAGGLLGMGLAVLMGPESWDDATPLFVMGALGADLGFLATYTSLSDNAREQADRSAGRLEFQLNPAALAALHPRLDGFGTGHGPRIALPLFAMRYRF